MSSGISEYWRERRRAELEKAIKFNFYDMVTALIYNRTSLKQSRDFKFKAYISRY